jgi:hypothetical protein
MMTLVSEITTISEDMGNDEIVIGNLFFNVSYLNVFLLAACKSLVSCVWRRAEITIMIRGPTTI